MSFSIIDAATGLPVVIEATEVVPDEQRVVHSVVPAAGELHIGELSLPRDVFDVTPTIQAAAYDSGDVLFDVATITNAMRVTGGKGELRSINLLDKSDSGAKITLVFFKITHSLGTINNAPSISDADAVDILGYVVIDTADYIDVGGAKFATKTNVGLMLESNTGSRDIFVAGIVTGTPTYASTSDIVLKLGIEQN